MGCKVTPIALWVKVYPHLAHSTLFRSTLLSHISAPIYFYYGVLETQHGGTFGVQAQT